MWQQQQWPQQQQQAPTPSDNIFIGDLPLGLTTEACQGMFAGYGTIVQCRVNGAKNDKCSALIRFGSTQEATWVVENLNGALPEGLTEPVIVRFANAGGGKDGGKAGGKGGPHDAWKGGGQDSPYGAAKGGGKAGGDCGGKGGGKGRGSIWTLLKSAKQAGILGGGHVPRECQLYIKHLPPDTTEEGVFRLAAPFGAIGPSGVTIMRHPDGSCKGIGFVDFSDPASVEAAIAALNGFSSSDGTTIYASSKASHEGKGEGKGK